LEVASKESKRLVFRLGGLLQLDWGKCVGGILGSRGLLELTRREVGLAILFADLLDPVHPML
jgi:hypothetical protein